MNIVKKLAKFITVISFLVIFNSAALATPTLQLDIGGGTYDGSTETIVASTDPFTLYAYLIPDSSNSLTDKYYISMAVVPMIGPPGGDLGSFTFNGTTVNVTSQMVYGVPPLETLLGNTAVKDSGDLSQHGIFETYFYETEFQFGTNQISPYNTQDRAESGSSIPITGTGMYYVTFNINTSLLDPNYVIHFDLYNSDLARRSTTDLDITQFAPFSHDAESNGHKVPEPTTLILLGSGLIGLGVLRRNFKN
jgi:hypothetical protein